MVSSYKHFSLPYYLFRGGSSKGVFLHDAELPAAGEARNKLILAVMDGMGADPRQIDGLGGGDSLTSKVAVVKLSTRTGVDLDYAFYQVLPGEGKISSAQTCGNMLAAVLPYALESGLLDADDSQTAKVVYLENTAARCEVVVQTPQRKLRYSGAARVAGVPGSGAPISCNYLATAGSTCGALFPTGKLIDTCDNVELTCVDNGMPVIIMRAKDFALQGDETPAQLNADAALKKRIENIRLTMAPRMNIDRAIEKTIPKMCLISAPRNGGLVQTRMFIPHKVHKAIGVLAAASVAAAGITPGTVMDGIAVKPAAALPLCIEHPSGEFAVVLEVEAGAPFPKIKKSGVIRTARLISRGEVFLPETFQL